jgi:hypothetical protein
MVKRLNRQEKWQVALETLINKMFEIAGHEVTFNDIIDRKDNWFQDWTMTPDQNTEWCKWGKKYLMKYMRLHAKTSETQMAMISLNWGLKLSESPWKSDN